GVLATDLITIFEGDAQTIYDTYVILSQYYSLLDTSEQYFGRNGEYTEIMSRRKRELERFWDMPNLIRVNAQHSEVLNDREKLADLYEIVGTNVETREDAYAIADFILSVNSLSPYIPESPFFSV